VSYYKDIQSKKDELAGAAVVNKTVFLKAEIVPTDLAASAKWALAGTTPPVHTGTDTYSYTENASTFKSHTVTFADGVITSKIDVYTVKIVYDPSTNNYGFDKPYHYGVATASTHKDYKTYVSVENNTKTTNALAKVTWGTSTGPSSTGVQFWIKPTDKTKATVAGDDLQLTSSNQDVAITGKGTASSVATELTVRVKDLNKYKTEDCEFDFETEQLHVKVYKLKDFDISLFKSGTTTTLSATTLNAALQQIVYKINTITPETFTVNPDTNTSGAIDYFNDGTNPEISAISTGVAGKTNPVVLVNDLRDNWRGTITAITATTPKVATISLAAGGYDPGTDELCDDSSGTRVSHGNVAVSASAAGGTYEFNIPAGVTIAVGDNLVLCKTNLAGLGMSSVKALVETLAGIQVPKVVVHELGHSMAGLKDTNNQLWNVPESVMQFDGAGSTNTVFRFRQVEKVNTGVGTSLSPRAYESHWEAASR
jgi:hypothetical protein